MSPSRVVVDGSNLATEGRSLPSLVQLDEAVRAYGADHPGDEIIVVVDATFAHRIAESEREMFEEAAAHNELVYPPAGAVGRGDAFLLRIAEKTDAVVLSNDSFQEFHGEHEWLFEKGRLVGGTPVPGVGWIFVARTPVRGPKSREAVKEARRTRPRIGSKEASAPMPVPKAPPPRQSLKVADSGPDKPALRAAIEVATVEAEGSDDGGGRRPRRRRKSAAPPELPTVNDPLTFITFVAEYRPGATVEGEVESFASHGAFVLVGDARCYVPLSAMGEPPPRSAREVMKKGDTRTFVVQALDAPRRGVELALPGHEHLAGTPTEETVEAEIAEAPPPRRRRRGGGRRGARDTAPAGAPEAAADEAAAQPAEVPTSAAAEAPEPDKRAAKRVPAKKMAARKAPAPAVGVEVRAAPIAPPAESTPAKKKAATRKAASKKAPADLPAAAPAKKAPAKTAAKKTAAKKAAAKKAEPTKAAPSAKKAAKKAPAKKKAAKKAAPAKTPASKAPAKKAVPAKAAVTRKAAADNMPAKKVSAVNAGAAKAPAKKAPAKKVPADTAPAKKPTKKAAPKRPPAKKTTA